MDLDPPPTAAPITSPADVPAAKVPASADASSAPVPSAEVPLALPPAPDNQPEAKAIPPPEALTASAAVTAPAPVPSLAPVVAPPTSPVVPEWSGPQATFGPLDPILPPVYLSGASLAALAASTSIKVLPDSSAAPPQTFTASHPTITTSLLRPVYPRPSMYGLYADNPIVKGDLIGEVLGEILAGELYRSDPINQYRSLGVPKPAVRALPAPLNLVIDQRGFGNETRFARNSCHPNAVLRPVVFSKKASAAESGGADEPILLLGLFASREIRGREEISVAWDWDDDHIVHALQPILAAHLKSPSTNVPGLATYLQPRFAGVLTHLSSVFYTCACPSKKDCGLAQMARVAESKPLLGLAEKSSGGSRSSRRQKRPDLGPLVGAVRGWRDDEKRRAALAKEAIDRVLAERAAAVAVMKPTGLFEPTTFLADDELELDDGGGTAVRVSQEDIEMEGNLSEEEDAGNASDASTLTEPMSHFSSDSESDDGDGRADPRTPQRSPSLSPPPLLRTPPVSRARSGVRRRPNNRVESESPPTTPPSDPLPPLLVAVTTPPTQRQQPADPESPLSDAPESSPVLRVAPLPPPSPPSLLLVPTTALPEAADVEMSAPPIAEDEPVSVSPTGGAAEPSLPAPPPPLRDPTPPPREPTPPPPKPPTPPPVKRMSLKDWAKRKKEAPTPAPEPVAAATITPEEERCVPANLIIATLGKLIQSARCSSFASAPPALATAEAVPSTPVNESASLDWSRQGPSQLPSSPTQPTDPSSADRFRPSEVAPSSQPVPSDLAEPAVQHVPASPSTSLLSVPALPARLSTLSSFTRRVEPQQVSPSAAKPPSPPAPSWSYGATPSPTMQMPPPPPGATYPPQYSAPDRSPFFYPGNLPPSSRVTTGGAPLGTRTPSPPPPPPAARPFGIHPDRDVPPHHQPHRRNPDLEQRYPEREAYPPGPEHREGRLEYGPGPGPSPTGFHAALGSSPSIPLSFAPPPQPPAYAAPPLVGVVDPLPTAASPFPPHRPSFGPPPPALGHIGSNNPGRGGFGSPAMRGGGRPAFAPPSGPRSGMAPPTGPRGFNGGGGGGGFRAGRGGRGGGDFVPRAPRSMAVEDQPALQPLAGGASGPRGGGGGGGRGGPLSERPPPPSWMAEPDRAGAGGPDRAESSGASHLPPPMVMPRLGGGGGGGGGYGGRGRGGFARGGGGPGGRGR